MQLGLTIPLQKHLKLKSLPYGEPIDLFFCWELHIIRFQGKNALAAVNANNRFLNRDICSPIGFEDYGYPVEFLTEDMKRVGVIKNNEMDKNSNVIEFRSRR